MMRYEENDSEQYNHPSSHMIPLFYIPIHQNCYRYSLEEISLALLIQFITKLYSMTTWKYSISKIVPTKSPRNALAIEALE